MSKIKSRPIDLSVSIDRLSICPIDKKLRGRIMLSPSTRSFRVLPVSSFSYRPVVSRGCLWSKCVRDTSVICSRCEYNLVVL